MQPFYISAQIVCHLVQRRITHCYFVNFTCKFTWESQKTTTESCNTKSCFFCVVFVLKWRETTKFNKTHFPVCIRSYDIVLHTRILIALIQFQINIYCCSSESELDESIQINFNSPWSSSLPQFSGNSPLHRIHVLKIDAAHNYNQNVWRPLEANIIKFVFFFLSRIHE